MTDSSKTRSALQNIRVLDVSRVLAGPFCAMILGDLGAEVIKIEVPGTGDDTRHLGPYVGSESAYFMNTNRNKKSITLDLKREEGRSVFFDLIRKSDVIVENFKPGVMNRLGIGYEEIKKCNPEIIYASISGFGHVSPYAQRAGYDIIGQAMGGLMSCTGWPDSPPTRIGTAMADILAGLFACIGILSGLIARKDVGEGQHIDIALVDSVVASMNTMLQVYLVDKHVPGRVGNRYLFMYPFDTFPAKDGWVVIGVGNDKLWHKFCEVIDRLDLLKDERYSSNTLRVQHYQELEELVRGWTKGKTVAEVCDVLLPGDIPCSPVYDIKDVVNDENIVNAREMLVDVTHPAAGAMKVVGSPIKMSVTPPRIACPAPLLGQHTECILKDILEYQPEKIDELKRLNIF